MIDIVIYIKFRTDGDFPTALMEQPGSRAARREVGRIKGFRRAPTKSDREDLRAPPD